MTLLEAACLPHTCTAKRRTRTRGSLGGTKDTFTTVFSARPCWQQPAGDSEINEFAKRGISITNKFYFLEDPLLTEEHIIIGQDGRSYEVRSCPKPDASVGLGVLFKVMAEDVTTDDPMSAA